MSDPTNETIIERLGTALFERYGSVREGEHRDRASWVTDAEWIAARLGVQHPITDELVERLRRQGAGKDLIDFTDRHVTRYSMADLGRAQWRAFLVGQVITWGLVLLGLLAIGGQR